MTVSTAPRPIQTVALTGSINEQTGVGKCTSTEATQSLEEVDAVPRGARCSATSLYELRPYAGATMSGGTKIS
jgi:hypothetical protein